MFEIPGWEEAEEGRTAGARNEGRNAHHHNNSTGISFWRGAVDAQIHGRLIYNTRPVRIEDDWCRKEGGCILRESVYLEELEANIEDAYQLMRAGIEAPLRSDSQFKEVQLEV